MQSRQINVGGGLKIGIPYVDDEILRLMNTCDYCGKNGEIEFNLKWIKDRESVYCVKCIEKHFTPHTVEPKYKDHPGEPQPLKAYGKYHLETDNPLLAFNNPTEDLKAFEAFKDLKNETLNMFDHYWKTEDVVEDIEDED